MRSRDYLMPNMFLDPEQIRELFGYLAERADASRHRGRRRNILNEFIIRLLTQSGLRSAEAISLNIEDTPAENGRDYIVVKCGKGGKPRQVFIDPDLIARIKRFCQEFRDGATGNAPLLVNERGRRFKYTSFYYKVCNVGKRAKQRGVNMPDLTPHKLRHTYATEYYRRTHDLLGLQRQLGHAKPETTAIYARTVDSDIREQVKALQWGTYMSA